MHELAITQNMLDIVLEKAKESGAERVGAINLVIGELSGFVEESVRFYFDFLAKDTIAEGAVLNFKPVSPQARCRSCDKPFEITEFDWSCPR
ncbi:MAG: hydrogenase maturation nickel metallochaperone HypA, partial [Dehalococcoidia bacterium]